MPPNLRLIHSGTTPQLSETTDARVARRFRLIRGDQHQTVLAQRSGIPVRSLGRWERGVTSPRVVDLERSVIGPEYALRWAADVLGVEYGELLELRNKEAA